MLTKFTFCATVALVCAGCANVSPVPGHQASEPVRTLQVRGDLIDLTDVKIYINDDKVIDEQVSLLRGDGEFRGVYAGKPVTASCSTAPRRKAGGTICLVSVDNERATTLTF